LIKLQQEVIDTMPETKSKYQYGDRVFVKHGLTTVTGRVINRTQNGKLIIDINPPDGVRDLRIVLPSDVEPYDFNQP
jgi:hypothetical protein